MAIFSYLCSVKREQRQCAGQSERTTIENINNNIKH